MEKIYCVLGGTSKIATEYYKMLNEEARNNDEIIKVIAIYNGKVEELIDEVYSLKNLEFDYLECDLSKEQDVLDSIAYIKQKYNAPTHILHLAAKKFEYVKFTKTNWEDIMLDMNIQVRSFYEYMKAFLPIMSKNKYGKVVVMLSSVVKSVPPKYLSSYVMVKSALQGLIRSLVAEYKEKKININTISPTMVDTSFLDNIDERIIEMTKDASSMKRNVKAKEVANTIKFLMSDESEYINGENILLTGGDII